MTPSTDEIITLFNEEVNELIKLAEKSSIGSASKKIVHAHSFKQGAGLFDIYLGVRKHKAKEEKND